MDITSKSLDELKVLAYDNLRTMELAQANLQAINKEIAKHEAENTSDSEVKVADETSSVTE